MIQEKSSAKKKKREMEEKKKENYEEADKSKKDQRENDDEVDVSQKDISQGHDGDDETQRTIGGAPDFTDYFHPPETNLTSVQESSSQSPTTKALDKPGEEEAGQAGGSTKDSDEKLEGDFTK